MHAQQSLRINTAPMTAALVIIASLVLGGFGGYAITTALRSSAAIPVMPQVVTPRVPSAVLAPVSNLTRYEGKICTADLRFCLEAQSSTVSPSTQQLPAQLPTFEEGRMCTPDFRLCREPQNSYD